MTKVSHNFGRPIKSPIFQNTDPARQRAQPEYIQYGYEKPVIKRPNMGPEPQKRPVYKVESQERPIYKGPELQERPMYKGPEVHERSIYRGPEVHERPMYKAGPEPQERHYKVRPEPQERHMYKVRPQSQERPMYKVRPESIERPMYKARPESQERPMYKVRPKSQERPAYKVELPQKRPISNARPPQKRSMYDVGPEARESRPAKMAKFETRPAQTKVTPTKVRPTKVTPTKVTPSKVTPPKVTPPKAVKSDTKPGLSEAKEADPVNKSKAAQQKHVEKGSELPTVEPNADGQYKLPSELASAVEDELGVLMDKIAELRDDSSASETEKLVREKFNSEGLGNFRNAMGLNITKRLLNVFNPLFVRLEFNRRPQEAYIQKLTRAFNCNSVKRLRGSDVTFIAQIKTVVDFDRLCSVRRLKCGDAKATVTPCYKFTRCPPNISSGYKKADEQNVQVDNHETTSHEKQAKAGQTTQKKSQAEVKQNVTQTDNINKKTITEKDKIDAQNVVPNKTSTAKNDAQKIEASQTVAKAVQKVDVPQPDATKSVPVKATAAKTEPPKIATAKVQPTKVTPETSKADSSNKTQDEKVETGKDTATNVGASVAPVKTAEASKVDTPTAAAKTGTQKTPTKSNASQTPTKSNTPQTPTKNVNTAKTVKNTVTSKKQSGPVKIQKRLVGGPKYTAKKQVAKTSMTKGKGVSKADKDFDFVRPKDKPKPWQSDELSDEDILNLLSKGIVLDECIDSDEEK